MDAAFIHDNLEIKFLILYIAARVSRPIPVEGMQELTLCDSGIDYFSFSLGAHGAFDPFRRRPLCNHAQGPAQQRDLREQFTYVRPAFNGPQCGRL